MNGKDIDFFLKHVKHYGGVTDLQHTVKPGYVYIVFTGVSPYGHWVVLDLSVTPFYFFDSLGKSPTHYGLPHMKYNRKVIQSGASDVCGLYCIYYVVNGIKGLKRFGSNRKLNDAWILKWILKWIETALFK